MKGKDVFSRDEIKQLQELISLRVKAAPDKQKGIRNKMRKIGFYGGDDFGVKDMTLEKFQSLIDNGEITIKN
jgi:hypothetical protein